MFKTMSNNVSYIIEILQNSYKLFLLIFKSDMDTSKIYEMISALWFIIYFDM